MLVYYKRSGINAVLALLLNTVILLAAISYFHAALTLPGIAGVILTIGMAVDSNVLIFERIREELRAGQGGGSGGGERVQQGVVDDCGHPRDHDRFVRLPVPVRGRPGEGIRGDADDRSGRQRLHGGIRFADDLQLGAVRTPADGDAEYLVQCPSGNKACRERDRKRRAEAGRQRVFGGRWEQNGKGWCPTFRETPAWQVSMELFKNTNYDFLGKKWPFIIASLVLTVAGFISIAAKGGSKYGIDFKEGVLMTVKFAYTPPLDKIRAAMSALAQDQRRGHRCRTSPASARRTRSRSAPRRRRRAQMNVNRQDMADVLTATFGQPRAASWISITPGMTRWPTGCAMRWRATACR